MYYEASSLHFAFLSLKLASKVIVFCVLLLVTSLMFKMLYSITNKLISQSNDY